MPDIGSMKMRILIADDNIALQEILTEIIENAGHTAETVSSAGAVLYSIGTFRPDVILLDIDMPEGEGLSLLDKMQNSTPPINIPVVVIRSWGRQIPQDIFMVKCHIEKPFTTADVLDSITTALIEDDGADEPVEAPVKQADTHHLAAKGTLAEIDVSFGKSYVMFQRNQNAINTLISLFVNEDYDVLVITTKKKKAIVERFGSKKISSLTMTVKLLGGHLNIYGLGTMIDNVDEFVKNNDKPVIAFDDLNKIIDRNGMNSALTAVHQLLTKKYDKNITFLVSVDPVGFTTKDKEILLNHMAHHDPIGE